MLDDMLEELKVTMMAFHLAVKLESSLDVMLEMRMDV